jgi:hypothetical protein
MAKKEKEKEKPNPFESLISSEPEQSQSPSWFDTILELPDTWNLGEDYGIYLHNQDSIIENTCDKINYSHDEHTFGNGYEMNKFHYDNIFGRW